jgi:hypothetical protein
LLIASIATLVGLVRIVWTRRSRLRFTLRNLLIAVSVVSIFLAVNRLAFGIAGPQSFVEWYVAFVPWCAAALILSLVVTYGVKRLIVVTSSDAQHSASQSRDWQINANEIEGANSRQPQSPASPGPLR